MTPVHLHRPTVRRGVVVDGEPFALVVESTLDWYVATTAIHRQEFQWHLGGARFVEDGDFSEVAHLAQAMSEKCLAAMIPGDGQKSIIRCPGGVPTSTADRAAILAAHIRDVIRVAPGSVFGPDMNNPEAVVDLVGEAPDLRQHVTGMSEAHGGFGIDRNGYTAGGLADAIGFVVKARPTLRSATIQGFGAVGAHTARRLASLGLVVRAISTERGAIVADAAAGLDIDRLFNAWQCGGDEAVARCASDLGPTVHTDPDSELLFEVPTDVFVPAARTLVLAMPDELTAARKENPAAHDVVHFRESTGAQLIAEAANYPLTVRAERYLEEAGAVVLPDYIVNCGGLIGAYFEWAYREDLLRHPDCRPDVEATARRFTAAVIGCNVREVLNSSVNAREAGGAITCRNRDRLRDLLHRCPEPRGPGQVQWMLESVVGLGEA